MWRRALHHNCLTSSSNDGSRCDAAHFDSRLKDLLCIAFVIMRWILFVVVRWMNAPRNKHPVSRHLSIYRLSRMDDTHREREREEWKREAIILTFRLNTSDQIRRLNAAAFIAMLIIVCAGHTIRTTVSLLFCVFFFFANTIALYSYRPHRMRSDNHWKL